ncbi:MAG TPA: Uma2 family endonuclease [Nostocaceae cyanobacterium]|nr:Uma2 family endonuclease [Nostocaceae cyanobacterium]
MVIAKKIIPLESGDRLSRHEFERRYAESDIQKAELIEGVVYVSSPLRFKRHAKPHSQVITWLGNYQIATPGVELGIEPTIRLDEDNEPQPYGVLIIDEKLGGKARITEDDYLEGAPELVVEIAASSAAYDLHDKKKAYRRNGVQEYIVWQILENKLNWFRLFESEYINILPDAEGIIKSLIMPGLWLDVPALLSGDMVKVQAVLQTGLSSQEHADFVKSLSAS